MTNSTDRRGIIAAQAVSVLASGGARKLSHRAIDTAASLPIGSTSYYYRSRPALITATIAYIRSRSQHAFVTAAPPSAPTIDEAARLITEQLNQLTAGTRRDDALAVFALLPEVNIEPAIGDALTASLFSDEAATELMRNFGAADPLASGQSLVDLLTGIVIRQLYSARTVDTPAIDERIRRFLHGCAGPSARNNANSHRHEATCHKRAQSSPDTRQSPPERER